MQTALDERNGLRLRVVQPEYPAERVHAVIGAASEEGIEFDRALRRMTSPAENITQSFADDFMQANAAQRSRAGFDTFIERTGGLNCCPWCAGLVGVFAYPKGLPKAILEEMRQKLRQMLEHYCDDLSDDVDLMEEALTTIENILGNRSYDEVMHHSRDMAILYLALRRQEERQEQGRLLRSYLTYKQQYRRTVQNGRAAAICFVYKKADIYRLQVEPAVAFKAQLLLAELCQ